MLIDFRVENFRSIRKPQTLSLVASTGSELASENTLATGHSPIPSLVRSAVIYGPNAAGKSSLVKAIKFMKAFVVASAKEGQDGDKIAIEPFLFSPESSTAKTEMEVTFIADGTRFQYGFSVDRERVHSEWLFAFPEGRAQRWFVREYDSAQAAYSWKFSVNLKGNKRIWSDSTRSNALFLSTAVQLNSEQLKIPFGWFKTTLKVLAGDEQGSSAYSASRYLDNEGVRAKVLNFLNAADLSIHDIKTDKKAFSAEMLPDDMPSALKDEIKKEMDGKELLDIKFAHRTVDGDACYLPEDEESDGTQKLFALSVPWLECLEKSYVLVVDELNNSLHPLIVRHLLAQFHGKGTNAQLIVTTHDTTLMDPDIIRRDQVWFVEKDRDNSTKLYPLTEFSPRKNEALEKGYLLGRYGALPYVGEVLF